MQLQVAIALPSLADVTWIVATTMSAIGKEQAYLPSRAKEKDSRTHEQVSQMTSDEQCSSVAQKVRLKEEFVVPAPRPQRGKSKIIERPAQYAASDSGSRVSYL